MKEFLAVDTYERIVALILKQPKNLENGSCEYLDWGYLYSFSFLATWFTLRVPFEGSNEKYHLAVRGAWSVQNVPGSEELAKVVKEMFTRTNNVPTNGISTWLQLNLEDPAKAVKYEMEELYETY